MLKITVELISAISPERNQVLGTAIIALQETNAPGTTGGYQAAFKGKGGRLLRAVGVAGFPRKRLLAWDLLARALVEAFGERNKLYALSEPVRAKGRPPGCRCDWCEG